MLNQQTKTMRGQRAAPHTQLPSPARWPAVLRISDICDMPLARYTVELLHPVPAQLPHTSVLQAVTKGRWWAGAHSLLLQSRRGCTQQQGAIARP